MYYMMMPTLGDALSLEPIFRAHCRATVYAAVGELEPALRSLLEAGRRAWPALALPEARFLQALAERAVWQKDGVTTPALSALHGEDLYLATAGASQIPAAVEEIEARFLRDLPATLMRAEFPRSLADEACQVLRERLFTATAGGVPKIASYDGRGALKTWLRIAAQRTAISLRRGPEQRTQPLSEAILAGLPKVASPELALMKERYQGELKATLQQLLLELPRERSQVLRLHLLDGLTLEQIGGLYRVNRSTVKRWLDDVRTQLSKGARRKLGARLGLAEEEVRQLIGLLQSQIDLSLSRILRPSSS